MKSRAESIRARDRPNSAWINGQVESAKVDGRAESPQAESICIKGRYNQVGPGRWRSLVGPDQRSSWVIPN